MYLLIFGLLISSMLVFLVIWSAMYLSATITRREAKRDETISSDLFSSFFQTSPIFRLEHYQTGDPVS